MQLLPIVQRELAVAARKPSTTYSRVVTAGIAFTIVLLIVWTSHTPKSLGGHVLEVATTILLIEALLAGLRYTCDAISEEKREGTLGLLFLTNLRGLDVALGKAAGRAMPALYNLAAVVPILYLALIFGGVTLGRVFSLTVAILLANLFSLAAGLFVSSVGVAERRVMIGTLALVAGLALLPYCFVAVNWPAGTRLFAVMVQVSPVNLFIVAADGISPRFTVAVSAQLAVIALFVSAAAWHVRRSFRDESVARPESIANRRRVWPELLARNPVFWAALRGRSRAPYLLLAGGLVLFGLFARGVVSSKASNALMLTAHFGTYGLHVLCKFLIAEESVRRLNAERRSGALELLLTTPLSPGFILSGHQLALQSFFRPILFGLAALNLLWMTDYDIARSIYMLIPCSLVMIVTDARALLWRGILNALQGKRYATTVFRTFFEVMLPPAAVMVFGAMAMPRLGLNTVVAQNAVFFFYTVCAAAYSLAIAGTAKARLLRFRELAAGEPTRPRGSSFIPDAS